MARDASRDNKAMVRVERNRAANKVVKWAAATRAEGPPEDQGQESAVATMGMALATEIPVGERWAASMATTIQGTTRAEAHRFSPIIRRFQRSDLGGYYGNGSRYGNPGGGAVGGVYGNYDTGNNPRGGSPVQPDNSPIPTQRAYDDSMRDLNQLRQAVQEDPEMAKQVQELIREMERLDPSRYPGNPALVEQLHSQVLANVDKLELQLRRQIDDKQSGQVRSGDTNTVPQGYEEPVAEYYRRLSKNNKQPC